jgi:NAD(P)-dependent dehydrogenase (short-subunit alcohol dehydrogenase family)
MTTSPFDFTGRTLWVVGGAGYLGQSVVRLLATQGARVLCVDLPGKASAFLAAHPELAERQVIPASLDVNDTALVEPWVDQAAASYGVPAGVAVLTYASTSNRLEELSAVEFDSVCHGNLTATFVLARAVAERMAAQGGGSLALFSSMYGGVAPDPRIYASPMTPNPIEYGVNKAGIRQMARYLAVHYGPRAVRCNSVSPGPFPNPGIQRDKPDFIERLANKVPLGRVGQAPEIAGAVAFLLSDAATYVTGTDLPVDGGWAAW